MIALLLRFDAPLVSFGGAAVDQNGIIQPLPALSMLAGMFGNALGWDHRDAARLNQLQARIRFACRIDRSGELLTDYQTVDLGQSWMRAETAGWTTRGAIAERGGDSANQVGTHQRYRQYQADSISSVAVTLIGDGEPTLQELARALVTPARPLFIGRKCCLPAGRILVDVVEGEGLCQVLAETPRVSRGDPGPLRAFWFDEQIDEPLAMSVAFPVTDERDWTNRIHVGRRLMREGVVDPPVAKHA